MAVSYSARTDLGNGRWGDDRPVFAQGVALGAVESATWPYRLGKARGIIAR